MSVLRSLALAFSCFTRLPVPQVEWKQENMRFMMAFLPLVGVAVGAFVAAWWFLSGVAGIGPVLKAVGLALVPVAVTGGFHLDGFADVVDAQASHADPERKRAILKDPHIGAFAALSLAAYLLAYFGLATELPNAWQAGVLVACVPVMSRCGAGFASTAFWGSGEGGTLTTFRDSADIRATLSVLVISFAIVVAAAVALSPLAGAAMAGAMMLLLAWLRWFANRNFGGMSGDVAGFFLQVCELMLLAVLVVVAKAVGL